MGVGGEGDRFVMTFSDVLLPVPFLASPFDLHRLCRLSLLSLLCHFIVLSL